MDHTARGRRRLALGAVVALVVLSGCVDYPPDHYACLSCETGIEAAAGPQQNVSVEASELLIQVRDDGAARWRVRADLTGDDVDRLRSDPNRVDRIATEAVTDSVFVDAVTHKSAHEGRVENVSGRLDGDVLYLTFVVAETGARTPGDVVLVDLFHTEQRHPRSWTLGADRVTIRGPPETTVTRAPPKAPLRDDGRTLVWTSRIDGDSYVAFAPTGRPLSGPATDLAVATDTTTWAIPRVALGFVPGVILVTVASVLSVVVTGRRPLPNVDADAPLRDRLRAEPPVLAAGVLLGLVAVAAVIVYDVAGVRSLSRPLAIWWSIVAAGLFAPLGYADRGDGRARRSLVAALFGTPFVGAAVLATTPPASVYETADVTMLLSALVAVGVGVPAYFVGRSLRGA